MSSHFVMFGLKIWLSVVQKRGGGGGVNSEGL